MVGSDPALAEDRYAHFGGEGRGRWLRWDAIVESVLAEYMVVEVKGHFVNRVSCVRTAVEGMGGEGWSEDPSCQPSERPSEDSCVRYGRNSVSGLGSECDDEMFSEYKTS